MQQLEGLAAILLGYLPEFFGGLALGVCLGMMFSLHLSVKKYRIVSKKVTSPLRIVLLCDLHSSVFGKHNSKLLDKVTKQSPNLVLFGGDTVDDHRPDTPTFEFLSSLAEKFPCHLVTGNHEFRTARLDKIRQLIGQCGVNVLQNTSHTLTSEVTLLGLEDPEGLGAMFSAELSRLGNSLDTSQLNILLTHRPEYIDAYRAYPYDLVLCGHAHGGQWRIPGLLRGFFAPGQGFFPEYTDDLYAFGQTSLLVSRGLSKKHPYLLRMFNRPQVVSIEIVPEK